MNATVTLTDHARVRALRGSGSTAEAAALAAALMHAGPGATLLNPRVVSADRLATCAIAARTQQPEFRP
jgi:cobalt-precorrin 5A hydrolase